MKNNLKKFTALWGGLLIAVMPIFQTCDPDADPQGRGKRDKFSY